MPGLQPAAGYISVLPSLLLTAVACCCSPPPSRCARTAASGTVTSRTAWRDGASSWRTCGSTTASTLTASRVCSGAGELAASECGHATVVHPSCDAQPLACLLAGWLSIATSIHCPAAIFAVCLLAAHLPPPSSSLPLAAWRCAADEYRKEQKDYFSHTAAWTDVHPSQVVGSAACIQSYDLKTVTLEELKKPLKVGGRRVRGGDRVDRGGACHALCARQCTACTVCTALASSQPNSDLGSASGVAACLPARLPACVPAGQLQPEHPGGRAGGRLLRLV